MENNEYRLYHTTSGKLSARPTSADKLGTPCDVYGEQYRRDVFEDRMPMLWGLKHAKTGKLTRIKTSRAAARAARKPTERVVAIWA